MKIVPTILGGMKARPSGGSKNHIHGAGSVGSVRVLEVWWNLHQVTCPRHARLRHGHLG